MYIPVQTQNKPQEQQGQIKIIGNYSYNLRHCLGEGAYGKVYEGIENKTQAKVAIKKMDIKSFEKDTYLKNQIMAEIEILKKFNHRNIVQFIDLITTQRSLYIITEFCRGGDLRGYIQDKKLNEEQCLVILKQLVEGFRELINHNVIHRDLKPANVLIHEGVFKICDFGFAKYVDYSSAQLLRSCVGSPLYMAPQILQRKPYGTKCDIWSLGIIYHEMLFSDVPWKGRDERDLLNNIMTQKFRFKNTFRISKTSEEFLRRCLVIEENDRISWEEIFKLLEHLIDPTVQMSQPEKGVFYQQQQPQQIVKAPQDNYQSTQPKGHTQFPNNQIQVSNNRMKKSIWDDPNGQLTNDNIMNKENYGQIPQGEVAVKDPQQAVKQKNQNKEYEKMKMLVSMMNQREFITFKHYIATELFQKLDMLRLFIKSDLINEKLLCLISNSVNSESKQLLEQYNELDRNKKELFDGSKEFKALGASLNREDKQYKEFQDDFVNQFEIDGILENLKGDQEISFIFQKLTDSTKERLENLINNTGKDLIKEINEYLKENSKGKIDEEIFRNSVVILDFMCDLLIQKKKIEKRQELKLETIYSEKGEHADNKSHLEKLQSKVQIINQSSSFSFF